MALNCRIFRDEKGEIDFVQTPDGNRSKLFDTLAEMTGGNKNAALNLYALTELEDFKSISQDKINSFNQGIVSSVEPSALTPVQEEVLEDKGNWDTSIANELKKVEKISDDQADTLEKVANIIYTNIAKRLGKTVEQLKRSMAIRTVSNVQEFLKDVPNSISELSGLSDQLIKDFSGVTEEGTTVDYQTVQPKYIKNLGIAKDNYIMSSLLDLEETFGFLGYTTKLSSLGNQEKITAEINRRLLEIKDRAANTNDFYIQELSPSFLQSSLKRAVTEAEKESIQALIDGNSYAISENIKNLQGIQRANLVSSLEYIIPSSDYSAEFKYMMVALTLKGNVAKDIEVLDDNGNVTRTIPGEKAKRNSMTVGNHQELSSMVLPNVYQDLKNGSDTHPIKLIDKHTDKAFITREETWDLIKDRIEEETENGYWVKFNKSSEEGDIKALTLVSKKVAKVMSSNPWCTGGGMASSYLPKGDFYLFLDKTLEPTITIRYDGSDISELKGTDAGQALSKEQADEAYKKLPKIQNGLKYANNIKTSRIYHKLVNNEDFSKQDLQDYIDTMGLRLETYDSAKQSEYRDLRADFDKNKLPDVNEKYKIYSKISSNREYTSVNTITGFDIQENQLIIGDLTIYTSDEKDIVTLPNGLKVTGDITIYNASEIIIGDNVSATDIEFETSDKFKNLMSSIKIGKNFYSKKTINIKNVASFEIGDNYETEALRVKNSKDLKLKLGNSGKVNGFFGLENVVFKDDFILPKLGEAIIKIENSYFKNLIIEDNSVLTDFSLDGSNISGNLVIGNGCVFKDVFQYDRSFKAKGVKFLENLHFERGLSISTIPITDSTIPKSTRIDGALRIDDSKISKDFVIPSSIGEIFLAGSKIEKGFSIPKYAGCGFSAINTTFEDFTLLENNMLESVYINKCYLNKGFQLPNDSNSRMGITISESNLPKGAIPNGMKNSSTIQLSLCDFEEGFTIPDNVDFKILNIADFPGLDGLPKSFSIPSTAKISELFLNQVHLRNDLNITNGAQIKRLILTNAPIIENFTIGKSSSLEEVILHDITFDGKFNIEKGTKLKKFSSHNGRGLLVIEPDVQIDDLSFKGTGLWSNSNTALRISKGAKINRIALENLIKLDIESEAKIGMLPGEGADKEGFAIFEKIKEFNVGNNVVFYNTVDFQSIYFGDSNFGRGTLFGSTTTFEKCGGMEKIKDAYFLRTVNFENTDIDFIPENADFIVRFISSDRAIAVIDIPDNSVIKADIVIQDSDINKNNRVLNIGKNVTFLYDLQFDNCTIEIPENELLPPTTKIDKKLRIVNSAVKVPNLLSSTRFDVSSDRFDVSIDKQDRRGAIVRTEESTLILLDKNNADVTTPVHELAHKYEDVLTTQEVKIVEDWSGHKKGTKQFREAFAKGAERYIYEGANLNGDIDGIFKRLKDWFFEVIKDAIAYFGDINELNPGIKDIYSKMLLDSKNKKSALSKPKRAKEYEGRSTTATTESGVSYLSESGDVDYDSRDGIQWEGDKINGVFRSVKGIWNKSKDLQFTGTTRVKNAADVAEIMSLLENKSVEHAFAVHTDAKGKSHIQFLSVGGSTGTVIDPGLVLSGVNKFKSKKVYLVHNHPSGNLNPSAADSEITSRVASGLKELNISLEHVIMDTYSKQYTILDEFGLTSAKGVARVETEGKKENLTTYTLNEQEILSEPLGKVAGAEDSANVIQQFRFSAMPKNAALILDQNNKIIGNYVFQDGIEYEELTSFIGEFGIAKSVIFYGNQDNFSSVKDISRKLEKFSITVLDHIVTASNNDIVKGYYTSAQRSGLLSEVQEKYGTNSVEDNRVEEPKVQTTTTSSSNVRKPVVDMNGARVFAADRINPITGEDTGQIELQLLESDNKGNGNARKAAEAFLKYTDSIGKDVYLAVSSRDGGITDEDKLGDFYNSLGFRNTSGFEMIRKARPVSPKGFDKNGEPDASTVLQFNSAKTEALENEEVMDVQNAMLGFGLTNSKDLYTSLMKALSTKGVVTFSRMKLERSKMYNDYEIDMILNSPDIQRNIRETLLKLRNTEEFSVEYNPIFVIPMSSELTSLGKQRSSNPFEIEREIADAVSDVAPEEIPANLDGVLAERYAQDKEFKALVDDLNKTTKSVPVKTVINGELVDKLPSTIGSIANTITDDYNGSMSENIDFLNSSIRKETWEESRNAIGKILNKIKKDAAKNGIDLRDLATKAITHSREDVLDFLNAMEDVLVEPSEQTLSTFADMYNAMFDITEPSKELIITDNMSDVFLDAENTEYELFRDHSLVKKQDGVYRIVTEQSLEDMYDSMMENVDLLPGNITSVEDLKNYVSKTISKLEIPDFQVDSELLEKMLLYKMYFGFPLVINTKKVSTQGLTDLTMDPEMLKDDFIKDFNKWILETNNKYFTVTERGIELIANDEINKSEAILSLPEEFKESLAQYDVLSRTLKLGLESQEKAGEYIDSQKEKRQDVVNNPESVKKLKGNYTYLEDGVMATKNETETFVRTPVGVFEMIYQFGNVKFYNKLPDVDTDYKLTDIEKPLSDIDFSQYQHLENSPEIFKESKQYYTKKELEQINNEYFNCK